MFLSLSFRIPSYHEGSEWRRERVKCEKWKKLARWRLLIVPQRVEWLNATDERTATKRSDFAQGNLWMCSARSNSRLREESQETSDFNTAGTTRICATTTTSSVHMWESEVSGEPFHKHHSEHKQFQCQLKLRRCSQSSWTFFWEIYQKF